MYQAYDFARNKLIYDIGNNSELDGILLALHGAMVVDGIDNPEGEILSEIKAIVGKSIPICISLDFHANITHKMTENATLMFPFRY